MAWLITIDQPRHPAEGDAQHVLERELPQSWYITTNMKEYHFKHLPRRAHTEIDSIVICPFGIFVVVFKSDRGDVTPNVKGQWSIIARNTKKERAGGNPFPRCEDKQFAVKAALEVYDSELKKIRVDYIIVLTRGRLNWAGSDITETNLLRAQVAELGQVEATIHAFSPKPVKSLNPVTVQKIVKALKGPKLPRELVESFDLWGQDAYFKEGQIIDGIVTSIDEEGAAVEICNNTDGRLAASEITWRPAEYPTDLLKKGQRVKAKIIAVDRESHEISLSMKELQDDPLNNLAEGTRVEGRVLTMDGGGAVVDFGDYHGHLGPDEITWQQVANPTELVKTGQKVATKIIRVDRRKREVLLSMKRLTEDPLVKLHKGSRVKARVHEIRDDHGYVVVDLGGIFAWLYGPELT